MPQNTLTVENRVRHPLRFKIFLVCLIPTVALLAAAVLNNRYLDTLGASADQILSKNYKSIRAAQEAREALEQIRNALLEKVPSEEVVVLPMSFLDTLSMNLSICRENITEAGERELIDRLSESHRRYLATVDRMKGFTGGWGANNVIQGDGKKMPRHMPSVMTNNCPKCT